MAAASESLPPEAALPPYDPQRLLALGTACTGHEREMVLELLLRIPWLVQEVTRGVVLRDAGHLALHARELRRCCDSLGAAPLAASSGALERMGERGDFRDARAVLELAHREHQRLQQALARHLAGLRAA